MTEEARCSYTHDITDEEVFEHMDGEKWSCQHPKADGSEYCLFHQPVEEKDDQRVVKRFMEIVNTGYDDVSVPSQERLRFIGAKFGDFSLPLFSTLAVSGEIDPVAAEYPIDLRGSQIEGALHWAKTTVRHDLLFDGVFVGGKMDFEEATIEGDVSFDNGQFASLVDLDNVDITGEVNFERAEFEVAVSMAECDIAGEASFRECHVYAPEGAGERVEVNKRLGGQISPGCVHCPDGHFRDRIRFTEATIEGFVSFTEATIEDDASFSEVTIENRGIIFRDATIRGEAYFREIDVEERLNFANTTIEGFARFTEATIGHAAYFPNATIKSTINFENATTGGDVEFKRSIIEGNINITQGDINGRIDFRWTTIGGYAKFKRAIIEKDTKLIKANIKNGVNCVECTIKGEADFKEATIGDDTKFGGATLKEDTEFTGSTIKGKVDFKGATIRNDANFTEVIIEEDADFTKATIEGEVDFRRATIGDDARFTETTIEGHLYGANFTEATVRGGANFTGANIEGDICGADFTETNIKGEAQFEECTIGGDARFTEATIEDDILLENTVPNGGTILNKTTVDGDMKFVVESVPSVSLKAADIRGDATLNVAVEEVPVMADSTVEGTLTLSFSLENDTSPVVDLCGATVGSIQIPEEEESQVLDASASRIGRFDSTDILSLEAPNRWSLQGMDFSDFEFTESMDVLTEIDWNLHEMVPEARRALAEHAVEEYADPDEYRAENNPRDWVATYNDAKVAAANQGLNEVAAEFFLREKRFKRKCHGKRVREGNSLLDRAKGGFDWVSNLTMDVTTGYGERPRNVVVSSLAVVCVFTLVYGGLNALPDGSGLSEYVLFSLQNFVTFIIGTRPQGTLSVRYVSAIEAFLGAFFVALFVFALTRSLNR